MRRALDAYRLAAERGAPPTEVVAVIVAAHEAERVELETSRCRASIADVVVAARLVRSRVLTVEEADAVARLAEFAEYHLRTEIAHDPVTELERSTTGG